ncbi:hypothetical protein [Hyphomicrobium sp. 2TAF46]|uniref:hypothetical protein n=1 Tax=Hyphomicrobium sp. 2TAF46 TaxID=3233019 RepID=UPI003F908D79
MHAILPALSSMIVFAAALFWTIGHGDASATAIGFTVVFTIAIGGTVVAALIVAQIATSKVDHLYARLVSFAAISVVTLAIALMALSLRAPHPDLVGFLKAFPPFALYPTIAAWTTYVLALWWQSSRD